MSPSSVPFRNSSFLMLLYALPIVIGILAVLLVPAFSDRGPSVVVYTALDQEFSQPIFEEFTRRTGIKVLAKFDTESTKTVGLTQALLAERSRPRCDLFWNNEIVNTLRLEREGLLATYETPAAEPYPQQFRSPLGKWHGFAARARVLIVNTELVGEDDEPKSLFDLVDGKWKSKVGIAKPLAGTTATHAACLFAVWGEEKASDFFRELKANAQVLAGNKQVALAVASGQLAFGLTDTDDAIIELEKGLPVKLVYPDQEDGGIGTLFIPNTLALMQNSPQSETAKQLVDFLLSPPVEAMLAAGPSAQIPLSSRVKERSRVEPSESIRTMDVDFEAAAARWDTAASFLRQEFATAD